MRRIGVLVMALAFGLATVAPAADARAEQRDHEGTPGGQPAMSEMMRGMAMGSVSEIFGRERPLLSLALRHRAELELSAEQVKTLEALTARLRKEAEARLADIDTSERDLAALLKEETLYPGQVEAKVRAIEALRADLRIARITTIGEGRAALTAEQRKKLSELVATGSRPRGERRSESPERERSRGMEEMHRFMSSERMPQAMTGMMEMARGMGDGDTMLGMVRMMEMMSMMGGDGGMMGGMMGGSGTMGDSPRPPAPQAPKPEGAK